MDNKQWSRLHDRKEKIEYMRESLQYSIDQLDEEYVEIIIELESLEEDSISTK